MVTSPSSSPPPPRSNTLKGGAGGSSAGSSQLLQELEALSQALYQSQKKSLPAQNYPSQPPPHPQTQPQALPTKKHSFLSRKEILSGRRSSHDPGKDVSSKEPIPFSGLSAHDPPPSFTNLLSRRSLSTTQAQPHQQQKPGSANSRPRHSSSVVSSQNVSAWGEEKSDIRSKQNASAWEETADIRSRMDRRLSLQPLQAKNSEKSISQEPDWPEDPLESSRRFDSSSSDKKKSVWSWKPFRAISHIGRQRLHCVFSAYVHAIEGLPPAMNGLRLCVHMRKEETKEGAVQTMPSRVFQGIAEFQETLFMKCTLYGNKGPSNTMKFMEKAFIVSVIAPDIDELDFGKNQLDLSRLLGDFFDDRKGQLEKGNSWDTTLDLTGKAKGGKLAITFNYEILDKDSAFSGNVSSRFRDSPPHRSSMHTSYSLPNSAHGTPRNITTRAHLSHSPSVSEPGNDYDDLLAMDQLNLDEPPPVSGEPPPIPGVAEVRGGQISVQTTEVQGFPAFRSQPDQQPIPSHAFSAFPTMDEKLQTFSPTDQVSALSLPSQSLERVIDSTQLNFDSVKKEDEPSSEDEAEFVVVEQGMEIDELMESHADDVLVEKGMDSAEEETSDDFTPQVVEKEAMDDLPQVAVIEALDDLTPEVVEMESPDDFTPHVIEMDALDDPIQVDEIEACDGISPLGGSDDHSPQGLEKSELPDRQGGEDDDEGPVEDVLDGELHRTEAANAVETVVDDKEVHEDAEKIVTVDGEKKDNVTYLMVMQTLDQLLQGTSVKELPQEEEKLEVESSADGIFSDEEDTADKEVLNIFSLSSHEEDSKNSVMKVNADVHGTSKDVEELGRENQDEEEEESGKKDVNEEGTCINDTAEEESSANVFEQEERGISVNEQEEQGQTTFEQEERGITVNEQEEQGQTTFQEEERGIDVFEEDVKCNNVLGEEERGFKVFEEEESSNIYAEVEGRGIMCTKGERGNMFANEEESYNNVVAEEERDIDVLDKKERDNQNMDSEFHLFHESILNELEGGGNKSTDVDVNLCEGNIDRDVHGVTDEDIDSEVDLVAGEFFDMLGMGNTPVDKNYDSELDSPRARLLKQFEEEALLGGGFGLDMEIPEFSLDEDAREEDMGSPTVPLHKSAPERMDKEPAHRHHASVLAGTDIKAANWDHTLALNGMDREPTNWDHMLDFKGMEKEPGSWDHTGSFKRMDEESANWDFTLDSKGMEKEPADWDHTLDLEGMNNKEPANWDHSSALKDLDNKETAKWDNTLGLKGMDKEPAEWDHTLAFKGMEKELASWDHSSDFKRMERDPSTWSHTLASKGMDKESTNSDHTLAWKDNEPAKWEHTLAWKGTVEPAMWDHAFAVEQMDKVPSLWDPPLALEGKDKEPANRGSDFSSEGVEKEPANRGSDFSSEGVEKEPTSWGIEDDEDLMSIMEAAESELQRATQSMKSKTRAKMLEDAETEALMQEWGLNEKAFVSSPPKPTIRQQEPPPLGKGLGATVPLKDGGSLRSMNPSHFQANKSNGKLVMQISKPVVVPAEMGSETVDILRNMASMGVENMALQAMTAMPLEDITGRSVEQVAVQGKNTPKPGHRLLEGSTVNRKELSWNDRKSRTASQNAVDDIVSLEDIAPMAMQQIEALAMDGLKIQSDVVEDEAPFTLNAFSLDGQSGGKNSSAGSAILKGVTGVHLSKGAMASADSSGDDGGNGLMGMAISLDEWMLLDAGLYDETETKKDTLAIMAAHHAAHQEMVVAGGGDDEKRKKRPGSKSTGARWGCMGNTLTIAMLVQLRDPLKNNEAVGAPMMAFVQAERLMKPPKMKVGRNVSMKGNSEDEEAGRTEEEPQFKITGVHMAGLKDSQEEKRIGWGNQKQLQSGSRWLIANGMSKNTKVNRQMLTSKPSVTTAAASVKGNANKGESLWSISSRALSSGMKWKDKLKLNSHRNPDVVYDKTVRAK